MSSKSSYWQTQRHSLPIFGHREHIVNTIRQHDSVVLVGETGSGKTTQVPQYLVEERLHKQSPGKRRSRMIAVTQPRRVAAITVADRVAKEMETTVGGQQGLVGYSVRFDEKSGPNTCIKFCTDGMLLREAQLDPLLKKYSIVVLDEAHERTLQTDILFAVVKQALIERRESSQSKSDVPPLRVVVMSATLDVSKFTRYFGGTSLYIPGRQHPVDIHYSTSVPSDYIDAAVSSCLQLHWAYSKDTIQSAVGFIDKCLHVLKRAWNQKLKSPDSITESHIYGALDNVKSEYEPSNVLDGRDLLVFLPGQDDIENTKTAVEKRFAATDTSFRDYMRGQILSACKYILDDDTVNLQDFHFTEAISKLPLFLRGPVKHLDSWISLPKVRVLPLFASMASEAQLSVFNKVEPNERKIILATNIAETSITIPGVSCVIDPGFVKVRAFDPRTGVETLRPVPVSKAQAWQRAGRAGREGPGECYRLYPETVYLELSEQPVPEIQRVLLSEALLSLLTMGVPAPKLNQYPFLDPPSDVSLRRALAQLVDLGAVRTGKEENSMPEPDSWLTKFGKKLAALPLPPVLSSVLIRSLQHNCLLEAAIVVAMLSVDTIFVVPHSQERQARKRHSRYASFEGDHWTLVNVFRDFEKVWRDTAAGTNPSSATVSFGDDDDDVGLDMSYIQYTKRTSTRHSFPQLSRAGSQRVSSWCRENFVHSRNIHTAAMIRTQILDLVLSSKELFGDVAVTSCHNDTEKLSRALAAGAYLHVAKRVQEIGSSSGSTRPVYRTLRDGREAMIHPHSVLYSRTPHPDWVVYGEVVTTSKTYLRTVSRIQPEWLLEYAPSCFKLRGGNHQ